MVKASFFLKTFALAFKKLLVSSVYAAPAERYRFIFFKDLTALKNSIIFGKMYSEDL